MLTLSRLLIVWMAIFLGACGGGGGGGGGTPAPAPKPQTIAFAQVGPLYKVVGDPPYSNAASGTGGSGSISYSSDTIAVATVDASSGEVTIIGAGRAKITAVKAADASYLSAQASYEVQVAPRSVSMTAWIGPDDAQVEFGPTPFALDVLHASDLNCDPVAVLTCTSGEQTRTDASPLLDPLSTRTRASIFWLKHGANISSGAVLPEQLFHSSTVGGTVVFNGRLWLLTTGFSSSNDAWSSADGLNWRLEASNVLGTGQEEAHLLVSNNAMWVIVGSLTASEVWRSVDGKNWAKLTGAAGFPGRRYFAAAAFNGRLWVLGGSSAVDAALNDLWSSSDGVNWVKNNSAVFALGRVFTEMTAFNGRLWAFGGYVAGSAYPDVWSTADGATWTLETANAAYGPRFSQRVITDGAKLWLIGGIDSSQSTHVDVWNSADGKTWTLVTGAAEFNFGANHGAAWWNNAFWVISAGGGEVWRSATGDHWDRSTTTARIPGDAAQTMASFQNRLWVVGSRAQLWSSSDGLQWSVETAQLPGTAAYPQLVALPDRLILISGWMYMPPNYYREVWQSTDGRNWSKVSPSIPVRAENAFQTLVSNGKLWMFGTNATDGGTPEIWSSPNGRDWTLVAANPAFTPRWSYQAIASGGRFYVIGGTNPNGSLSDVWTSADGASWTVIGTPSGLPATNFASSLALPNSLCVYGGASYGTEAWCSPDGGAWTRLSDSAPIGPRAMLNGAAYAVGNLPPYTYLSDYVWKSADGGMYRLGYQNTLTFP